MQCRKQQKLEKQKTELYNLLKTELLEVLWNDIASIVRQSNLEVKDDMEEYLKVEISSNKPELLAACQVIAEYLKKGQVAVKQLYLYSNQQCIEGNENMGRGSKRCQSPTSACSKRNNIKCSLDWSNQKVEGSICT